MNRTCPICRKVCKSANGFRMHFEARHHGAVMEELRELRPEPKGQLQRRWMGPELLLTPPPLDEQIASVSLAYRLYAHRMEEAVEERNVTPHTAYHNCCNVLHAIETLRWLRKNEAAIKQLLAERKAA